MSDLMLLGALRAPTPEPDNILGIHQLADRARQAADALEKASKLIAELDESLNLERDAYLLWKIEAEHKQKRIAELEAVLDKLARLGNEPHYGNSIGNSIARAALVKG